MSDSTIEKRFKEIREFYASNADPKIVEKYSRYFTEGYDAYGVDRKVYESQRDSWIQKWSEDFSLAEYLFLGERLIQTGKYEEASFAIAFIVSAKDQYAKDTFSRLGGWLEKGIGNWAHTDLLSGRVLSHFFLDGILEINALKEWTASPSKWKRRAVPVTLIEVLKTDIPPSRLFAVIESLMTDDDPFVQKGLGWFLRETWKIHPEETEGFLLNWKDTCGRIIVQYATKKMDRSQRLRFRRSRMK